MESLNLNTLANSLPTSNLANAEKDLLNSFKAAALSITTLYRSSRHTSKRAYNAGYAAACQDLLLMIQQGVSVGGVSGTDPGAHDHDSGMTIGKVMDWIEARLDAIKSREDEEDEDEEREREKERGRAGSAAATASGGSTAHKASGSTIKPSASAAPSPAGSSSATTAASRVSTRESAAATLPTPRSPLVNANKASVPSAPASPSPQPPQALRPIHPYVSQQQRFAKSRALASTSTNTPASPYNPGSALTFSAPTSGTAIIAPDNNSSVAVGAKRRHAVMMLLDSTSSTGPVSIDTSADATHHLASLPTGNNNTVLSGANHGTTHTGGSRRRTRSSRGSLHHSQNRLEEPMEVEEDGGRERKRVARR